MPTYKTIHNGVTSYYCKFYYTDWQGQRRQKKKEGFAKSGEAKQWERDFLNKAAGTANMTFANLAANYLEDCKTRLKPTTYQNKVYMLDNRFTPLLGKLPIKEITPIAIRKWQNKILNCGYAPTYQRTLNSQLSAILNYAVKYYGLSKNPVHIVGTIGKKHRDKVTFWTLDEFKKFIATFDKASPLYAAYMTLFYTGIREGELLALTAADIDTKNNTLSITKNYAVIDRKGIILPPKTPKSKRTIDIPEKLTTILIDYMEKLYDKSKNARLFYMLNKTSLNKNIKNNAPLAGVKHIRVHDIRHSHASLLINMGVSPLAISERLGHEKVETTLQIYSHLYPDTSKKIASKLDNFF